MSKWYAKVQQFDRYDGPHIDMRTVELEGWQDNAMVALWAIGDYSKNDISELSEFTNLEEFLADSDFKVYSDITQVFEDGDGLWYIAEENNGGLGRSKEIARTAYSFIELDKWLINDEPEDEWNEED